MKSKLDIAVALRYEEGVGAPKVTAKGKGIIAEQIMEIARENDIPLYEEPELVELLSAVELDQEIPETLYIAVAEIIAFVYRIADEKSR
ncbi:MAG: flagellar biosynthesis protein FlhB [Thiotrichales bacterium]|jgi:flagellar biosynthesis protein|nr:flagellar biosynthesis protein FlhB [Thiotrichales bacterium]MBT3613914.1 flagellar biosynthesis protein FlhB [Thiotrichales bacterium]MBT3752222.1 flagellar biosynthesis protein FlhB [Thiotrichales bacterium]MBT3836853.1 flagellar biosynthesis protein FlhB [Thiotrichales bacterium]MBT4151792.1 flagellar biosynthesis protein FlhB [Thiotrichales bacterium]